MTDEISRPYEPPTIELIGGLTDLTLGDKFSSMADLQSGQPAVGPGS